MVAARYVAVPAPPAPCACPTRTHPAQLPQDKFWGLSERQQQSAHHCHVPTESPLTQWREEGEGGQTDTAMHVQQRPED